jgi:hypothetical protein
VGTLSDFINRGMPQQADVAGLSPDKNKFTQQIVSGPNETLTQFTRMPEPFRDKYRTGESTFQALGGGEPLEASMDPQGIYGFRTQAEAEAAKHGGPGGMPTLDESMRTMRQMLTPHGVPVPGIEEKMAGAYAQHMENLGKIEVARQQGLQHASDVQAQKEAALHNQMETELADIPEDTPGVTTKADARRAWLAKNGLKTSTDLAREERGLQPLKQPAKPGDVKRPGGAKVVEPPPKADGDKVVEPPPKDEMGGLDPKVLTKLISSPRGAGVTPTVDEFIKNVQSESEALGKARPQALSYVLKRLAAKPGMGGISELRKKLGYELRSVAAKYGAPEGFEFPGQKPGQEATSFMGFRGHGLDLPAPGFWPWGRGFEWVTPQTRRTFTTEAGDIEDKERMEHLARAVKALEGQQ